MTRAKLLRVTVRVTSLRVTSDKRRVPSDQTSGMPKLAFFAGSGDLPTAFSTMSLGHASLTARSLVTGTRPMNA